MNEKTKIEQEIVDNPCISQKTLSGVTFSSDDRQFIKRQFDGVYEFMKDKLSDNQRFLAEIIIDNNTAISNKFDRIYERLEKHEKIIFNALKLQEEKVSDALKLQEEKVSDALKLQEEKIFNALKLQEEKVDGILQKQIINENNMLDILHGRNAILQKQIVNENNILEILHEQDEKLVVILSGVEDNMNNINLNISEINKKFNVLNKKLLKLEARIVNIEKNLRM